MSEVAIDFPITDVFRWNIASEARYNVNQGGTWSGKTRALCGVMLILCAANPGTKGTIVGQDYPHLEDGAIDDCKNIWQSSIFLSRSVKKFISSHGKQRFIFHNGSVLNFKSYKNTQSAKSGKRNFLFMNECNGIPFNIYSKLEERTDTKIFFDYNPDTIFWVHRKVLPLHNSELFISNCFDHNPFTPEQVKDNILRKGALDENYLKVYGYGLTGKIKGLVFKRVFTCRKFPEGARRVGYGLDWGYSNSPTVLVKMGLYRGDIYGQQLIYEKGMSNKAIARRMKLLKVPRLAYIVADSADPKSIADLATYGFNVIPAKKGKRTIKYGITLLNEYPKIFLTQDSDEWLDEANRYKYLELDEDRFTEEPIDKFDHCWDSARYYGMEFLAGDTDSTRKSRVITG